MPDNNFSTLDDALMRYITEPQHPHSASHGSDAMGLARDVLLSLRCALALLERKTTDPNEAEIVRTAESRIFQFLKSF